MSDLVTIWLGGIVVVPLAAHGLTDGLIWDEIYRKRDVMIAVFAILLWPLALVLAVLYWILAGIVSLVYWFKDLPW